MNIGFKIIGPDNKQYFGHDIAFTGSFSKLGFDNIAVSSLHNNQSCGEVFVVEGRKGEGGRIIKIEDEPQDGVLHISGEHKFSLFGFSIQKVGDVNGDGYQDIVVSSPLEHDIDKPIEESNIGVVRIYAGRPDISGNISANDYLIKINDIHTGSVFGYSVVWLGELSKGNNYLAIGAPGYSSHDREFAGAVFLVNLSNQESEISVDSNDIYILGSNKNSFLGMSIGQSRGRDLILSECLASSQGLKNNGHVYILDLSIITHNSIIDLNELIANESVSLLVGMVNKGFAGNVIAGSDDSREVIFSVPGESHENGFLCGYVYMAANYEAGL